MESIDYIECADGYRVAVRRWTPVSKIEAQITILHGVVSHSEWLAPLGAGLAANGIEVICPDRRGAGLNDEANGDAPSRSTLVNDVISVRRDLRRDDIPTHLAGFCWGAVHAICCAEADQNIWDSLLLIAPSVFPSPEMMAKELVCGDSSEATEEPLVPIDRFTHGRAYQDYIIPDPLRTRAVSRRFNSIMRDMSTLLAARWGRLSLPTLLLLASDDTLVDNEKHEAAFEVLRAEPKIIKTIAGEHGLQFDAPSETCGAITEWIRHFRYSAI